MATEEKKPAEAEKAADAKPTEKKEEAAPEAVAEKSGKRRKLFMIIGAAVAVLAIGGGAAFFLMGGKKGAGQETAAESHDDDDEEHAAGHGDAHGKADGGHGKADAGHGKADAHAKADGHGDAKKDDGHGKADAHAKADAHGKSDGHGKDAGHGKDGDALAAKSLEGIEFGATMPFKTFHLNLGNPLENHYLRLEISVEYKGGEGQKSEIDARMPQLRDAVVSVASRKSREFLLGPDGKEQLRRELLIRLNRYMSKPVEAVYITDMLIE